MEPKPPKHKFLLGQLQSDAGRELSSKRQHASVGRKLSTERKRPYRKEFPAGRELVRQERQRCRVDSV